MIKSYTDYLFEKEGSNNSSKGNPKALSDPFFWIGDSVAKILELSNLIVGLGGFSNDKDAKPILSSIDKAQRDGVQTEVLESVKSLVDYMIKKPKSDWKINGIPIKESISLPLRDALDYISIAIEKTESGIKNLKDYKQPEAKSNAKQGKKLDGFLNKVKEFAEKPINLDINKFTEKINSTVGSLTNPGNSGSKDVLANNARYSLKGLNDSVNAMRGLANSMKGYDEESIESDIKDLDAISGIISGNLNSLKGEDIKSKDISRANEVVKEQTANLDKFRQTFFAKYDRYIQESSEYENIKKNLSDAREKINSVNKMITDNKEATKMFKGYDRDAIGRLDSKADNVVNGLLGITNTDPDAKDLTIKKDQLKVDKALGEILGKDPGEYKTSIEKLGKIINGKN